MIDLMTATQDAFVAALKAAVPATVADVRHSVKENASPPLIIIGAIDTTPDTDLSVTGEQFELVTVEVQTIYRGNDRGELLALMHQVRAALDRAALTIAGASFGQPKFVGASASTAAADGVTYAGISNFEVHAQPA